METLHEIVTTDPDKWQEKQLKEIYRIEQAASKLVIHVEKCRRKHMKRTILIIEDDIIFSRSISNWLKKKIWRRNA